MCTFKRLSEWKTAEEDIVCYKLVTQPRREDDLYSPLVMTDRDDGTRIAYEVGKEYEAEYLGSQEPPNNIPDIGFYSYREPKNFGGWAFHAVLRCTIPKGTMYVEGDVRRREPGNRLGLISKKIRIDAVYEQKKEV